MNPTNIDPQKGLKPELLDEAQESATVLTPSMSGQVIIPGANAPNQIFANSQRKQRRTPGTLALILLVLFALMFAGATLVVANNRKQQGLNNAAPSVPAQTVKLPEQPAPTNQILIESKTDTLLVNGSIYAQGDLRLYNKGNYVSIQADALSQNRTFILPDANGTICLSVNNCQFVTLDQLNRLNAQIVNLQGNTPTALSAGTGITVSGNKINNAGLLSFNGLTGNLTLQGTNRRISISAAGNTLTLSTPQDIDTLATPTFQSINLTTAGTQNGNTICDSSNNCGISGTGDINQGGNAVGTAITLGSNDNFGLNLETNNTVVASFSNAGAATFRNSSNSITAFQIQNSGSAPLFVADTTNDRIYIGNPTPDTTGASLVLDVKNNAGDPVGTDGAMYYNSNLAKFRCYENSSWKDCITGAGTSPTLQVAYDNSTGGTTPEIKLDGTRGALDIQDANATIGASLFNVRGSNAGGLGTAFLSVSNAGQTTLNGALSQSGGTFSVQGNAASSLTTSSGALTITSAAASTWSTATGTLTLQGGSGTVSLGTSTNLTASAALNISSGGANNLVLDTGGAAAINLGSTNATAINLQQNTVLAAGRHFSFTAGAGNFDQSSSTGTFATGSGAVSLNGATTLAANRSLTFAAGNGNLDQSASTGTFATGTGNVSLNGATTVGTNIAFTANGSATFRNATNGTAAFRIQNSGTTDLFVVDSTNDRVYIGNPTPDTVGTILVMDVKSNVGDPAGTDGAMYYNSSLAKFRCYENGSWKDCITGSGPSVNLQTAYDNSTGGTTPEIKVDSTRGGVDIQDADSTISGSLFNVRGSNGSGLGTAFLSVASTGGTTINGGLTQSGGALSLQGNAASSLTTSSGALTITSNAAATWSTATGNLTLQGGSGTVSFGSSTNLTATAGLTLSSGGANSLSLDTGGAAAVIIGNTNANAINLQKNTTVASNQSFAANGSATFRNATNGATAFLVQNAGGTNLVAVDTSANRLVLGQSSTVSGAVQFLSSANTGSVSLAVADPGTSNYTITLPAETGTVCTTAASVACTTVYASGSGSGSYIQNQFASPQTANFYISGDGRINNSLLVATATNNTAALNVQNDTGVDIFVVDTANSRVYVGDPTPDTAAAIFALDVKTSAGDPSGIDGAMYYNSNTNKFRCYESGAWKDCIPGSGPSVSLQTAYDNSTGSTTPEIKLDSTRGALDIQDANSTIGGTLLAVRGSNGSGLGTAYFSVDNVGTTTLTGALTQSSGAVTLQGNGASSLTTSSGALTITSNAAATWSTTGGNLTLQAGSGTVSLGTSTSLTASGVLGISSGGANALTLTSGAAATWSTALGNLTLQAGSGTVSLGTSTALTANGALGITSGGANALSLDTGGAAAINIGATNANGINLQQNVLISNNKSLTANGNATFASATNSTSAFMIQRASAADTILVGDTTNNRLLIGNSASATAADVTLFVVDSAIAANEPAGVNGGMYYDTTNDKFRCFEGSAWKDCITGAGPSVTLQTAYTNSTGGTTPEIKVDGTRGGVDIQDANSTIGAALLTVRGSNGSGLGAALFSVSSTGIATFQNASNSTNAFSIQNSTGGDILIADTSNNRIVLGESSVQDGTVRFLSASNTGSISLVPANPGTNNYSIIIPDENGTICTTAVSVACSTAYASGSGSGNYIQNQNSGPQSSANFYISGDGRGTTFRGDTSVLTPLLDTATAVALNVGTNNATVINLNQNSVIAAGKNLTFASGAGNFDQSSSTGTFATGSGTVSLNGDTSIASNKSFTANGSALFKNATNGTAVFQIQNSTSTPLFVADSTNNRIYIGDPTPDTTGAILVLDDKNNAGDPTGVNGGLYYNSNAGKFRCYEGGAWKDCITGAGPSVTLQTAYNNSTGGTTPEIKADGTRAGLDIQDADSTIGGILLSVRASNGSGLGQNMFSVNSTGQVLAQNSTNSTTAFSIQNQAGTSNLFVADTSNTKIGIATAPSSGGATIQVAGTQSITNTTAGVALQITQSGNTSNSTSVGGAINLDNSSNTGAGLVIYSSQAAPTGRLLSVRANNVNYNQNAAAIDQAGTGTGLYVHQTNVAAGGAGGSGLVIDSDSGGGTNNVHALSVNLSGTGNANSVALNVTSANAAHSAVQVSGNETGRGTVKITHTGTGTDGNAAALSLDLQGVGTAAQGIFLDSTSGGTTGKLLNLRNNGTELLTLNASGDLGLGVSGTPTAKLDIRGNALFKNTGNTTTAFQIQNASNTPLFVADTSNSRIYIGDPSADNTGALLVLDTKNGSGDPTGVDGGLYYNSNAGKFRCYENSSWKDCITTAGGADTLQTAYTASTGGTTPEIKVDGTRGGVDIQDANSTIGASLLTVRGSNAGGLGSAIFDVSSAGTTTVTGGLTQSGGALSLQGNAASSVTTTSGALTITSAAAATWSTAAGNLTIQAAGTNSLILDTAGAGVVGLGNTNATTLNIGNSTAATAVTIQGGTGSSAVALQAASGGTVSVGANAVAQTVALGNTTGTSALNLRTGTGNFTLDGVGGTTYTLGASTTTGTLTVGGASQTGAITIGQSTANNAVVNIGTGNVASGNTQTINIGTGVAAGGTGQTTTINIGNTAGAVSGDTVNVYLGSANADFGNIYLNSLTVLQSLGTADTSTYICRNSFQVLATCTGGANSLQGAYTVSTGGTTPEIKVDSTRGAVDIQDADSTINGSLLTVRASNGSGLGAALFDVNSTGQTTFRNSTNSNIALQIQNATSTANANLLLADTTNVNTVVNPSFETDTSSWAINTGAGSIARNTSEKLFGNASLAITTSATANAGAKYDPGTVIVGSTNYGFSFWAKGAANFTIQAGRSDSNVFGGETTCTLNSSAVTTNWARYTCSFTTGGSITSGGYVFIRQSDSTARTFYVDGVQLESGTLTPTNYREGNLQFNGAITNPILFQGQADSNLAFQIQNSAGSSLFSVDSTNSTTITIGGGVGNLGAWTQGTNLVAAKEGGISVYANGYLYYMGGLVGGSGSTTVYSAKVNANGSLGSWSTLAGTPLPAARVYTTGTYYNGYIYVVGGSTDGNVTNNSTTIYYSKVNSDGTLAGWNTVSNGLNSNNRQGGHTFAYNGYLYYVGGWNTSGSTVYTSYYWKLGADGAPGTFGTTTGLDNGGANNNYARAGGSYFVANGYIYIVGGYASSLGASDHWTSTIQYSQIAANGTLGSWTMTGTLATGVGPMPGGREGSAFGVANGYVYVVGGCGVSGNNNNVYYAPIGSGGALGTWTAQTTNLYPVNICDSGSAMVNGYLYSLGGTTGSTTNATYYASVARTKILTSLDLVDGAGGDLNSTGAAGSLTAGNTNVIGDLAVQGESLLQGSLYVGEDLNVQGYANFKNAANSATAFQVQNASGSSLFNIDTTNNLSTFNTNILIGKRTDSGGTTSDWTKRSQTTAGTIASGGTSGITGISAMAVFNGSLYVGTNNAGAAEVYRYDGGSTWTKVSQTTAGTIAASGTSAIQAITAMAVYNGQLYIGTSKADAAEVYRYDGGTTWTKVSQSTAGTIAASGTATIDIAYTLTVHNGSLYLGTYDASVFAEVYRYDGGTAWTKVSNATAGTIASGGTSSIVRVGQLISYNGSLYAGTEKSNSAEVYRFDGGTTWTKVSQATAGTIAASGTANIDSITTMEVYNGALYIGTFESNSAEVYRYDGTGTGWTKVSQATAGTIAASGTANIDVADTLAVYNGALYLGTNETNSGEVYRFDGGTTWTKVSQATAGTVASGGTANIDAAGSTMIGFNDLLYVTTSETAAGEVYTYSAVEGQSYSIRFGGASDNAGSTEQSSFPNYGAINFTAEQNAIGGLQTGTFQFSHSIVTTTGAYDLAEDYATRDDSLVAGDLVSIDPNEKGFVRKASGLADPGLIGVYSTKPALRLSQSDAHIDGGRAIPVALAGRVPIKVTTEQGVIVPGDPITTSPTQPGKGVKAIGPGRIVGMAMEAYAGEGSGTITIFINPAFYTPSVADQLQSASGASIAVAGLLNVDDLKVANTLTTKRLVVLGHIVGNPDTRGSVTVVAGASEIAHEFETPYDNKPFVVVTPTSGFVLYHVETTKTGFTVKVSGPPADDLLFNYIVQE